MVTFTPSPFRLGLKFSFLLPFSKTQSILSSANLFLISVRSLSSEDWPYLWGDQIEDTFLIEFINKSRNFAKLFKFKSNFLHCTKMEVFH